MADILCSTTSSLAVTAAGRCAAGGRLYLSEKLLHESLNMLNPRGTDSGGVQIPAAHFSSDRGFIGDPRPPEYMHKKNTVKELLIMRRQKWSCWQDDTNLEPNLKSAKREAFDSSPHLLGPPVSSDNDFPPVPPEKSHIAPRQTQPPAPTAGLQMTLFHWQIQREAQRVGGVCPELLNTQDADGDTCLHIAVAKGRRALAYVLATNMSRCGSLDTKEHNGQTALQIAAATNQHLIVADLLTHGAQMNTRDIWGRSPLHVCAEKGHFLSLQSIWRTLTGSGISIDIEMFNYEGLTPLHTAVLSHNVVLKELRSLDNPCAYMTMKLAQRRQTYVQCIQTLVLMGSSYGTKDLKSGRTCLHMASEDANVELLNIFLSQPSSLSIVNSKTFSGNTALHVVSSLQNHKSQVEAVKLLMRNGADPGARNFDNELPSQLVPQGRAGEKVHQLLKGKYVHA